MTIEMNKYIKTLIFTALLIGFGSASTVAQVGITSVPFLQIEPDSRAPGMGNAGVAIADNASAVFWNPAGLAFQTGTQIAFTHANWLPNFNTDLFYDYLVGKTHIEGIGTIGGHITFLNLGEQIRTSEDGTELGRFTSYELAAGASYAFKLTDNFALGTGFRFIYSRLTPNIDVGGQTAKAGTSVGVDLAALYRSDDFELMNRRAQFSAGFNLSNIGPAIQYTDDAQKDPLPTLLRLGTALDMDLDEDGFNTLTFAADISKIMARNDTAGRAMGVMEALFKSWDTYTRYDGQQFVEVPLAEQLMIGVGLEYWYNKQFAVRTGYFYEAPNNGDRQFITFGAGLRYNIFGVDFSYLYTIKEDSPLANTIRISVLVDF
jgi:long-subunit fatty acid transport protein